MRLKLDLDTETAERLVRSAVDARRSVSLQAEVLLRRVLEARSPVPEGVSSDTAKEENLND